MRRRGVHCIRPRRARLFAWHSHVPRVSTLQLRKEPLPGQVRQQRRGARRLSWTVRRPIWSSGNAEEWSLALSHEGVHTEASPVPPQFL